eukprot:TRINITY_DN7997_c0_g2_i1.p1 TRINITY_DN7997_c0_g2~~TRINITY_DN7997_c0_g2_i1.p1  ORF type:complete len:391 (+),score=59.88 TRINITY_DN7997_c0_g2_i1:30-1202(+)
MGTWYSLPTLMNPMNSIFAVFVLMGILRAAAYASQGYTANSILGSMFLMGATWTTSTLVTFLIVKSALLTPAFLLPALLIGRFIIKGQEIKAKFLQENRQAEPTTIKTKDGLTLDAMLIKRPESFRYVVWFNANGVPFEQNLDMLAEYGAAINANVLTFNYRGVGDSEGWPFRAADLIEDGRAAMQHLLDQDISESYIIMHGHSLGGGVVGELAASFPQAIRIHDRSFKSLTLVAASFMVHLNGFMAMALCCVMGLSFHWSMQAVFPEHASFAMTCVTSIAAGYILGRLNVMRQLAPVMLKAVGWELQADQNWNVQKSLVIFHRMDEVIRYDLSSIHPGLLARYPNLLSFELRHQANKLPCHMYPFTVNKMEFNAVALAIRGLFGRRLGD